MLVHSSDFCVRCFASVEKLNLTESIQCNLSVFPLFFRFLSLLSLIIIVIIIKYTLHSHSTFAHKVHLLKWDPAINENGLIKHLCFSLFFSHFTRSFIFSHNHTMYICAMQTYIMYILYIVRRGYVHSVYYNTYKYNILIIIIKYSYSYSSHSWLLLSLLIWNVCVRHSIRRFYPDSHFVSPPCFDYSDRHVTRLVQAGYDHGFHGKLVPGLAE